MERMTRPSVVVVPASAVIPSRSQVRPPPNQFTHEVRKRQPYYYGARAGTRADGTFAKGTRVVLMVRGTGRMCRVVDERGLYVLTACDGLQPIAAP